MGMPVGRQSAHVQLQVLLIDLFIQLLRIVLASALGLQQPAYTTGSCLQASWLTSAVRHLLASQQQRLGSIQFSPLALHRYATGPLTKTFSCLCL